MNSKTLLSIIITAGLTAVLGACSTSETEESKTEKRTSAAPVVEVIGPVSDQPFYPLSLPGELKPFEQVEVFAKAKGFVKELHVDRGSKVRKGQLLAVLEAPEISQQYLAVQASERKLFEKYQYSRQAYQRLKKAASKAGAVAEMELDRAIAQLRSDSAAYHSAKASTGASAQLRAYLRIRAPFSGTIVSRNVSVGALVGENGSRPLFSIAQQDHLRLTVAIPEKHAHSVTENTSATFAVSNRPGKVYKAFLSRNSGLVDQEHRSVTVEFDVENSNQSLRGGEYAQVKLLLMRPDSTLWVPASSVVEAQSGTFVLKASGGVVQRIPITLGLRREEMQEVFGQLSQGDKILLRGSEELENGTKVVSKTRRSQ